LTGRLFRIIGDFHFMASGMECFWFMKDSAVELVSKELILLGIAELINLLKPLPLVVES
jgi:hypothetical protein